MGFGGKIHRQGVMGKESPQSSACSGAEGMRERANRPCSYLLGVIHIEAVC